MPYPPPRATWLPLVEAALAEDLGPGDATSLALIEPDQKGEARLEARQELVVCGLEVAREVFAQRGRRASSRARQDGDVVAPLRGARRWCAAARSGSWRPSAPR